MIGARTIVLKSDDCESPSAHRRRPVTSNEIRVEVPPTGTTNPEIGGCGTLNVGEVEQASPKILDARYLS